MKVNEQKDFYKQKIVKKVLCLFIFFLKGTQFAARLKHTKLKFNRQLYVKTTLFLKKYKICNVSWV